MAAVVVEELSEELAAAVATWLADDGEGTTRLQIYGEHPWWWNLVSRDPHRHGFIACCDGAPVGVVDLEIDGNDAFVAILVHARWRGQHLGRRLLALAADEARRLGARVLSGDIEPDNVASIRCCAAAGFQLDTAANSGLVHARLAL